MVPQPSDQEHTGAYVPLVAVAGERFAPGVLIAGRFRVVAPLGKGGMGEVYRADDLTLGQPVALKFLPAHIAGDPDRVARFRKEVAVARRVSHPHVCRVYDIVEFESQPFLTMEFVDGEDLSSVLKRLGRVSEEKGVEIARQLCSALAAVHEQGLLHRDLKPANVMLDGRGKVRLTDFGLAAAAEDLSISEVRSGTPLYQSPEQLCGKEVTVRSDVYALGLVLYELFTGKRAFADAKRDSSPSKPSSHVSGLSPALEMVILRCLASDPANRPRSAVEVLAALPGGDPLAAALAAGLTPSPQLVADAGNVGLVSPRVGWALTGALFFALAIFAILYPHSMAFSKFGGLPKSTEWLSGKARAVRELADYPDGAYEAVGFDFDRDLLEWVAATDTSPERWDHLDQRRAAPIMFWHRESPNPLVPGLFYPYPGSIEMPRVTRTDPPSKNAGMTGVRLATDGRLLEFHAVPSEFASVAANPPNWELWFQKADLKITDFHSVETPEWVPPVAVEKSLTWLPNDSKNTALPVRVEAGVHRGQVVWFRVTPIWRIERATKQEDAIGEQSSYPGQAVVFVALVLAVIVLAPTTLRSGRGDRRAAFLLASGVFAIVMFTWAFETRHVLKAKEELRLFSFGVAASLYWSALIGFSYLVLEPFVRRWWPVAVISWNRLLVGRVRDPLVGRDILIGTIAGVANFICWQLVNLAPRWVGEPALTPQWDWWVPNTQVAGLWTGNFLFNIAYAFRFAFFYNLLLLLLLRWVFRRQWLAGFVFVAFNTISFADELELLNSPSLAWPLIALGYFVLLVTLVRFGALPVIVMCFTTLTLWFPMSLDPSRDYFMSGLVAIGVVIGMAAFGLYSSTGGWLATADKT